MDAEDPMNHDGAGAVTRFEQVYAEYLQNQKVRAEQYQPPLHEVPLKKNEAEEVPAFSSVVVP